MEILNLFKEWSSLLCPATAALSGVICSIVYLSTKYKQRFIYVLNSFFFYLFITLSLLMGTITYVILGDTLVTSDDGTPPSLKIQYFFALMCGSVILLGELVGIPRQPFSSEKQFFTLISLLRQPLEKAMESQIQRKVTELSNDTRLKAVPTNILASAIEQVVENRVNDEKLQEKYGLDIEEHRVKGRRMALINVLLDFYPPEGVTKEFVDFCLNIMESRQNSQGDK